MTTFRPIRMSLLLAGIALAFSSSYAADKLSKEAYKSAKDKIEVDFKTAKAACDAHKDNAKDVCMKEAKATEQIAKAELEYNNSGKDSDRIKVEKVKAEQTYEVAKERCDDKSGADKNACQAEAKAAEKRAQAAIKADKKATSG